MTHFTHFNFSSRQKSLQFSLGKKLAKRVIQPIKIREISSISGIDLNDPENVMDTQDIYL